MISDRQLFLEDDRLLDDDVPLLPLDLPEDRDTPDDRLEDRELRTADEPEERPEEDLPTDDDLEDLLPAASRRMDDAAFPAPLNSALPNEPDPDLAGSRLSRDMVRAGDVTGRSCSVLNREVCSPEFKRSIILRLTPVDSNDLAEL
jgi:hypothetical protein